MLLKWTQILVEAACFLEKWIWLWKSPRRPIWASDERRKDLAASVSLQP
jgi:hypothetical protein